MGEAFNYAEEFKSLDLVAVKNDLLELMTNSQDCWPADFGQFGHGVFTNRPETLTNDFFVNLLDMQTKWQKSVSTEGLLEGYNRVKGGRKWTGTVVDLVFGSNSKLRAIAEVYVCSDSQEVFVHDFFAAWNKVMNLDCFDLAGSRGKFRDSGIRRKHLGLPGR
ncbi:MAG: hypothetical protein HGA70_03095 [Chlorobiaceae bacterium]|nr:hypothetical protein [Chlorobiaceae bacterium]